MIHEVNLCQDTNSPSAKGVNMAGEFEGFRVNDIDVGGRHGEDNTVRLGNIFGNKVSSLLLNIGRLVANGDLWMGYDQ